MHSPTSAGKFKGMALNAHHRTLFRDSAEKGKFGPWRQFLTHGGDPRELRNLDFEGKSLGQVARRTAGAEDLKLLGRYGLV